MEDGKTLLYIAGKGEHRELKAWSWNAGEPAKGYAKFPLSAQAWASALVSRRQADVLIFDRRWRLYDLKTAKPIWPESTGIGHTDAVRGARVFG